MPVVNIILDSDQHYHYEDSDKKIIIGINKDSNTLNKILNLCNENHISAIVLPGDFTNHGFDAKRFCCFFKNGQYDEFGTFINEFYTPLKNKVNNVLCSIGNHSSYVAFPYTHKPEYNFINREFGKLYYSREIDGIKYYCCSLYPNAEIRNWLKFELEQHDIPSIIFFHYNLAGDYSDWWPQQDKDAFLQIILPHKDKILCIFNGHYHVTSYDKWNDFNVCIAAATQPALCSYDTDTKEFKVVFN